MSEKLEDLLGMEELGSGSGPLELEGREAFRVAVQRMAEQAQRKLEIFTYDLDACLYDQLPFLDAVKRLALESQYSHIHIILQESQRVQQEGHRLVELARRLPSHIEIRHPAPDHTGHGENFLIADETGYVHRMHHERYEGRADFNDRLFARQLSTLFTDAWENGLPESSLRRLYL